MYRCRILRSHSAKNRNRRLGPWGQYIRRGRVLCLPPSHHNRCHHRQSRIVRRSRGCESLPFRWPPWPRGRWPPLLRCPPPGSPVAYYHHALYIYKKTTLWRLWLTHRPPSDGSPISRVSYTRIFFFQTTRNSFFRQFNHSTHSQL